MALIHEKIPKIMGDMGYVGKNKKNQQQNYQYRGIEDIYVELQKRLAAEGVFCVPEVLNESRSERTNAKGTILTFVQLKVQYTFYASDGSSVEAVVIGEGMDSGDKACNKALSVAQKYAFIQTFCIPTDEAVDPEVDSHEFKDNPENFEIPFGEKGRILKNYSKEELTDMGMKLKELVDSGKGKGMHLETLKKIELVLSLMHP